MFIMRRDIFAKVLIHLLVWSMITFMLMVYPSLNYVDANIPRDFIIKQVLHIVLMIASYYLNSNLIVQRYLLKGKILSFGFGIISVLFCSSFALNLVDTGLNISEQMAPLRGRVKPTSAFFDSFGFFTTLFVLAISTTIAIIEQWNRETHQRQELERQRSKTELSFLKAQIHPHFFFNTLNSIYALTYTDTSIARKVLHTLSRMMRYLLYETEQTTVALSSEIAFIEDYVEVMKLRVTTNIRILFSAPKQAGEMMIAPMLLLPFVENAFKHGIDDIAMLTIEIVISSHGQEISLATRNTIAGNVGGLYENDHRKGIGVANTLRRLEIMYRDSYTLETRIDESTNEYHLNLNIKLT